MWLLFFIVFLLCLPWINIGLNNILASSLKKLSTWTFRGNLNAICCSFIHISRRSLRIIFCGNQHQCCQILHNYFIPVYIVLGWLARDPSILRDIGYVLLQECPVRLRQTKQFIFADDCFQLLRAPKQKTMHVISNAIETLSGCKLYVHVEFVLFFIGLLGWSWC